MLELNEGTERRSFYDLLIVIGAVAIILGLVTFNWMIV
jgi:hypothetical protein